jgi:hypothetical protein
MTSHTQRIRYPQNSQLIQKAFNLIYAHTGQSKAEIRKRYAQSCDISADTVRAWQSGTARPHRPEEIAALAYDGITLAHLDGAWLCAFLRAVDAPSSLRQRIKTDLRRSRPELFAGVVPNPYELVY